MRVLCFAAWGIFLFCSVSKGEEMDYRIAKVNIEFTNERGETDSEIGNQLDKARFQRMLENAKKYAGIRYRVFWKGPAAPNLALKLESQGLSLKSGRQTLETLSQPLAERGGGWTSFDIQGDMLKSLGQPMAWKLTIFQDGRLMAERKSFTWQEGVAPPPQPTTEPLSNSEPSAQPTATQETSPFTGQLEKPKDSLPASTTAVPETPAASNPIDHPKGVASQPRDSQPSKLAPTEPSGENGQVIPAANETPAASPPAETPSNPSTPSEPPVSAPAPQSPPDSNTPATPAPSSTDTNAPPSASSSTDTEAPPAATKPSDEGGSPSQSDSKQP